MTPEAAMALLSNMAVVGGMKTEGCVIPVMDAVAGLGILAIVAGG
jgi:hypothetical protein